SRGPARSRSGGAGAGVAVVTDIAGSPWAGAPAPDGGLRGALRTWSPPTGIGRVRRPAANANGPLHARSGPPLVRTTMLGPLRSRAAASEGSCAGSHAWSQDGRRRRARATGRGRRATAR